MPYKQNNPGCACCAECEIATDDFSDSPQSGSSDFSSFSSDNSNGGTVAWALPGNAQDSDDSRATATPTGSSTSEYLKCLEPSDLSAIDDNACIISVTISIERRNPNPSNSVIDDEVKLVIGGVVQADNKADTVNAWPGSDTVKTYTFSDLVLSGAEIKAADFGVVLSVTHDNDLAIAEVDHVQISSVSWSVQPDWEGDEERFCESGGVIRPTVANVSMVRVPDNGNVEKQVRILVKGSALNEMVGARTVLAWLDNDNYFYSAIGTGGSSGDEPAVVIGRRSEGADTEEGSKTATGLDISQGIVLAGGYRNNRFCGSITSFATGDSVNIESDFPSFNPPPGTKAGIGWRPVSLLGTEEMDSFELNEAFINTTTECPGCRTCSACSQNNYPEEFLVELDNIITSSTAPDECQGQCEDKNGSYLVPFNDNNPVANDCVWKLVIPKLDCGTGPDDGFIEIRIDESEIEVDVDFGQDGGQHKYILESPPDDCHAFDELDIPIFSVSPGHCFESGQSPNPTCKLTA